MAPKVTDSPTELIQHAQKSTDAWGGLSIATGAAMKPEKCYAYFMTYTVRGGHHILESILFSCGTSQVERLKEDFN